MEIENLTTEELRIMRLAFHAARVTVDNQHNCMTTDDLSFLEDNINRLNEICELPAV